MNRKSKQGHRFQEVKTLSEPVMCLFSHCKDFAEVNILPIRTHESIDPGRVRFAKIGFGQYSSSICGGALAGAIGGAFVGRPSPSKYR